MKKILSISFVFIAFLSFGQVQYGGGVNTFISTANSSIATLTSGSVFTGTSEDVSQYSEIRVSVFSDVASATDGLSIQQSVNGTNWDITDVFTVPATIGKTFGFGVAEKFFRIVYTNGGTNQGSFRLQVILHKVRTKPSSNRPADGRTNDNDMEENLAYGMWYDQNLNVWNRLLGNTKYTGQSAQTATVNNILTPTSGSAGIDVSGFSQGSVTVTSTATGGAYVFESSADGTNWHTMTAVNATVTNGTLVVAAVTPTSSTIEYIFPITNIQVRLRISTTITGGSIQAFSIFRTTPYSGPVIEVAQSTAASLNVTATGTVAVSSVTTAIVPGTGATNLGKAEDAASASGDAIVASGILRQDVLTINTSATGDYQVPVGDTYGSQIVKQQQLHKAAYSMAFTVVPAATATDIFQLIGSATKTVEVTKIIISGTQTTGGAVDVYLSKRSTANTGGTSTSATAVVHNSNDAVATAVGTIYTANPTTGTPVGNVWIEAIAIPGITVTTNDITEIIFGVNSKPIVLNGVAQALAINLNGVTITGGALKITVDVLEY